MSTRRIGTLVVAAVLAAAGGAAAQVSPTSPPHPTNPWNIYSGTGQGQVIRYIPVPPQPVTIEVPVDVPAGVPPQTQQQTLEIPGYTVTETTTGYFYPERWTLQQTGAGVYTWQKLPQEFRRK
jgi:hypothetical protein